MTHLLIRRTLWVFCAFAVIWAFATALTGGFMFHVGEWPISSRNPRNPLILVLVSGLLAWWLSRREGQDEGLALWTWCQARFPVVLVLAAAFELAVLVRPGSTFFRRFPLGEPDPFTAAPPLTPLALPLLLMAGLGVLSLVAWKGSTLLTHPRRTLAAAFVVGMALHLAMLGSLKQGLSFFGERAISSGHAEFFHYAVIEDDLQATLENYEPWVRPHVYLSNKGPGMLPFFRGLTIIANSALMRPLLASMAPGDAAVRPWFVDRGVPADSPHLDEYVQETRYLMALMFVLYPVLTLIPMVFLFWIGRSFVDDTFGLLAAMTYMVTPEAHLSFAHLDFSLFPLLAIGTVAPFVIGVHQRRLGYVAISAIVFMLHFTMTLAALSVVVLLIAFVAADAWQRIRRRDGVGVVLIDGGRALVVFGLVSGLLLTGLYFGIHFHPIERYSYARSVQRNWVTSEYNLFWATANALGYFLSFGLVQTALLLVQLGRSTRRVLSATGDGIALLAVAWLGLLLLLLAFSRQHGETNRLWTFLTPVGCLLVARYMYDLMSVRRWWLTMTVFFVSLILMRYCLNYY